MEVIIKRKYIYLKPSPIKNIKNGLWIEFEGKFGGMFHSVKHKAYTDIIAGKNQYEKPKLPSGFKIIKAWVANN